MATWLNVWNGSKLPRGVRIRVGANGTLRLYVRLTDPSGRQRDIATQWVAKSKQDIDQATAYYHQLRVEFSRAKTGLEKAETVKSCNLADIMAMEFQHWMRPGKTRTLADQRSWETNAKIIGELLGPTTMVTELTSRKLHQFIYDRAQYEHGGRQSWRKAGYSTAFRSLTVLRNAIRRAQNLGHIPDNWTVRWPSRDEFDRQAKDSKLTANVIDRHLLAPFFDELAKEHMVGPNKSDYGRCIVLMFKLAYHSGMRAGELERLRVRDVDTRRLFITPKYGDPFWCDLYGRRASEIAEKVIEIRGLAGDPDAKIFASDPHATKLSYRHNQAARAACRRLKLPTRIKLRDMRATAGRREYDGTSGGAKDIERAQRWLRHASIEMTQRYLKLAQEIEHRPADDLTAV